MAQRRAGYHFSKVHRQLNKTLTLKIKIFVGFQKKKSLWILVMCQIANARHTQKWRKKREIVSLMEKKNKTGSREVDLAEGPYLLKQ